MDLLNLKTVSLGTLGISEAQVEAAVANDPSLLGLGSGLVVVERQRRQAGAGILDLLLEDAKGATHCTCLLAGLACSQWRAKQLAQPT